MGNGRGHKRPSSRLTYRGHHSLPGTNKSNSAFLWGRRRQGDVAHFCELHIARRAIEGFRLIVCVVDIVHGPSHDISRGAANFFWDQVKGGRVAATGAAPPCETFAISRWADGGWHNRTNPVPLRSAYELWGRHDLTPNE